MIMWHIVIILVLKIFRKKFKSVLVKEILLQMFSEYKHMTQSYMDTFALYLPMLNWTIKAWKTLLVYFHQTFK